MNRAEHQLFRSFSLIYTRGSQKENLSNFCQTVADLSVLPSLAWLLRCGPLEACSHSRVFRPSWGYGTRRVSAWEEEVTHQEQQWACHVKLSSHLCFFLLLPSFLPCSGEDFLFSCNASELKEVVATIHGLPQNEAYIWGQRLYYRQWRGFGICVVWGGKALESFRNRREVIWLVLCEDSSSRFPKWWQKGSEGRRKWYN